MLSPLSWWNDLFLNLPISLLFGYLVAWLNADWFLPGTVVGYWLSNVLGILMMQFNGYVFSRRTAKCEAGCVDWIGWLNALHFSNCSIGLFSGIRITCFSD